MEAKQSKQSNSQKSQQGYFILLDQFSPLDVSDCTNTHTHTHASTGATSLMNVKNSTQHLYIYNTSIFLGAIFYIKYTLDTLEYLEHAN